MFNETGCVLPTLIEAMQHNPYIWHIPDDDADATIIADSQLDYPGGPNAGWRFVAQESTDGRLTRLCRENARIIGKRASPSGLDHSMNTVF